MARAVKSHQDVPAPVDVSASPGTGVVSDLINATPEAVVVPAGEKQEPYIRFLRNSGPVTPTITLKDGTEINFPTYTSKVLAPDDELVEKIKEVAGRYQIHVEDHTN